MGLGGGCRRRRRGWGRGISGGGLGLVDWMNWLGKTFVVSGV